MVQMEARILFYYPENLGPGVIALIKHGCKIEVLDWVDEEGGTDAIWIMARTTSEPGGCQFFDWVKGIVGPLGGDVIEAGASVPLKVVRSGITGGYEFDELADGNCVVRKDGQELCIQPTIEAMRKYIDAQKALSGRST
jgi:hypothetical protein